MKERNKLMENRLPTKIKVLYSLGQFGWSILSGIIQVWLVWFYFPPEGVNITEYIPRGAILGFLTLIGLITMAGRLMDAVTDPLIAGMSDKSRNPKGRRIPFMAKSAVPFALLTLAVYFAPVNATSFVNVIWLTVTLLTFYVFMTLYVTPYFALITDLSRNANDRLDLSTYTALTWFLGYILASGASFIWPVFQQSGMELASAVRLTFVLLAAFALVMMLIPVFTIDERKYVTSAPTTLNTKQALKAIFGNRNFMLFEVFFLAYGIAITVFQTGNVYYVTVLLGFEESMVTIVTAATGVLAFVLYPAVNKLAKRLGKKLLCIVGMVLLILAYCYCAFLGLMPLNAWVQVAIFAVLAGVGFAIFGILPNAIVADFAKIDAVATGEPKEGMYFAVQTFMNKLGQMIAMVLFASLLLLGNSSANSLGIRLSGVVAAVIGGVALILFLRYQDIRDEDVAAADQKHQMEG